MAQAAEIDAAPAKRRRLPTILVVGGYGAVGRLLCRDLAETGAIRLIVAGRRLQPARALAEELGGEARQVDLDDAASWAAAVAAVDLVLMCMDQTRTDFVAFVFAAGIHYADITAGDEFFRALEGLPRPDRSAALLSVGLAPGLTNLLAVHCASRLERAERTERTEIGILFGLGDVHGKAAIEWLAARLFDPSRRRGARLVDFGAPWGRRRAHRVDFSDQHALMRTGHGGHATTSIAFESRLVTAVLFGLAGAFAGSQLVRTMAVASFGAVRLGSKAIALSVTATGPRDGGHTTFAAHFRAEDEALTTARLAAVMVRAFLAAMPAPGVWHSHQVLDAGVVMAEVERRGIGHIDLDER